MPLIYIFTTMMKKIFGLGLLFLAFVACDKTANDGFVDQETNATQKITNRNLNIRFRTTSPNGDYAPFHVLAVWIERADGTFVRSLKVRAKERKTHLYTWKSVSANNTTDAITGATISQHTSHIIDWNLLDADQNAVTNGDYKLMLELTDQNAQGPVAALNFALMDTVISQQYEDQNNFKDIIIEYSEIIK